MSRSAFPPEAQRTFVSIVAAAVRTVLLAALLLMAGALGASAHEAPMQVDCQHGQMMQGEHDEGSRSGGHVGTCCVFHCTPLVPFAVALIDGPFAPKLRIRPVLSRVAAGVTPSILVPPPRV